MKNTYTGSKIIIVLLFLSSLVNAMPEPTGIRQIDSNTIIVWNKGSIANETFYDSNTGLWQYANKQSRKYDVTYVYGGAKNASGTWFYVINTTWSGTISNGTDWNNYYWLSSNGGYSMDGAQAIIIKNDSQSINDDHINMTFSFKSPTAKVGEYYLVSGLRNVDINRDGLVDMVTVVNAESKINEFIYNQSGILWWNNVSMITISGNIKGNDYYDYAIYFPKGVIVQYNHTSKSTNGDLTFYERIGSIVANRQYNFSYAWIDANCNPSCQLGCVISGMQANISSAIWNQAQNRTVISCKMLAAGVLCPTTGCSLGAGCGIMWRDDSDNHVFSWNDPDHPLKCGFNSTYTTCDSSNVPTTSGLQYHAPLIGGKYNIPSGTATGDCYVVYVGGSQLADWGITIKNSTVNTTLWGLVNNTVLNSSVSWINPGCNWTNFTLDNMSITINNTINYTVIPGSNFTKNISFDYDASWIVQCRGCYSNSCANNWNGQYVVSKRTVIQNIIIFFRRIINYLLDRSFDNGGSLR